MLLTLTSLKKLVRTNWAMPRASCFSVLFSCSLSVLWAWRASMQTTGSPVAVVLPEVRAESAGFHADKLRVRGMVANCLGDILRLGGTFSFPYALPFAIHDAQVG